MNPIAIITALKKESNAILTHLSGLEQTRGSQLCLTRGRFREQDVFVAVSGIGRKRAASAAEALIAFSRPAALVSCGWAGALEPSLRLGDVIIVKDVYGPSGDPSPCGAFTRSGASDPALRRGVEARLRDHGMPFATRSVVTVDRPAATADDKRALRSATGAQSVDMETAALLHCAEKHAIPFLGFRSVSDTSRMTFDGRLLKYHERKQRTRFILRALTRPGAAGQLIIFKYGMHRACRNLEKTAHGLLCHLEAFCSALDKGGRKTQG